MQTINLTVSSGPETLAGTLITVDQTEPAPAVLLLSGSGPIDRDSNTKKLAIGVMGQVADHLAGEGLASFRYDKRRVGASSGDYKSTPTTSSTSADWFPLTARVMSSTT